MAKLPMTAKARTAAKGLAVSYLGYYQACAAYDAAGNGGGNEAIIAAASSVAVWGRMFKEDQELVGVELHSPALIDNRIASAADRAARLKVAA